MMNDLISRQAAIDAFADMYRDAEKWGQEADDVVIKARAESCMASLVEMKLRIEKLPPAQPEIIKCKDCKHWLDIDDGRQKHRMCADVYGNWFCADAERREE